VILCFVLFCFLVFFREAGGQRERERENLKQSPTPSSGGRCRARSHNPEIMTRAEIKSQTLNQPTPRRSVSALSS